ncbi:hypothetical protein E4T56_gene13727 [Termitomyces sp. T112]|nr:hypothetical protein E4T56_gene13727 [Termitomyces sp. T112]
MSMPTKSLHSRRAQNPPLPPTCCLTPVTLATNSTTANAQSTLAHGAAPMPAQPVASRITIGPSTRIRPQAGLTSGIGTLSIGSSYLAPLVQSLPIPPACPNTDPRANTPLLDTSSLPRITSSLNEDAWLHYLHSYPDQRLVSTLSQIIQFGANLGFSSDRTVSQCCTNLKSMTSDPSVIATLSADIAAQITNGQMCGPFVLPLFGNFHASPIGAVTRKRSSKVRRIHHLSWLEGSSVNDGIPEAEATIIYDMVEHAIHDLVASGPGSLMLKLDLKSAFWHIPVRHADWPLLGFEWLGKLYHNVVLAFGTRSAPYIFNLFAEALHWILQHNILARVCHYLDDFLAVFSPLTPLALVTDSLSWVLKLGVQLGLTFQPAKIMGPNTTIEFLGLELDSIAMEVRLPQEKLKYLRELTTAWCSCRRTTRRDLYELTGFLQFASQVIPAAHAFIRSLYDFAASFPSSPFISRHIPKSA